MSSNSIAQLLPAMSSGQGAPEWVELFRHILNENTNYVKAIQDMFHLNNKNMQAVSEDLGALTMYTTSGGGHVDGCRTYDFIFSGY